MATYEIAQTILQQLGGHHFIAMTGATNLIADAHSLGFRLPAHFAKKAIRFIRIDLEPSDTYRVSFFAQGKAPTGEIKLVADDEDISVENLRQLFTEVTGLYTHL